MEDRKKEKKEFEIGEEFQVGLIRVKCVEATPSENGLCPGCIFYNVDCSSELMYDIIGNCTDIRKDGKEVKFKRI